MRLLGGANADDTGERAAAAASKTVMIIITAALHPQLRLSPANSFFNSAGRTAAPTYCRLPTATVFTRTQHRYFQSLDFCHLRSGSTNDDHSMIKR
ncbi:hypothetical protein ACHAWT_008480 [Skeletonema menzelii]